MLTYIIISVNIHIKLHQARCLEAEKLYVQPCGIYFQIVFLYTD